MQYAAGWLGLAVIDGEVAGTVTQTVSHDICHQQRINARIRVGPATATEQA